MTMRIFDAARKLEAKLTRTFNDAAQRVAQIGVHEPLEIMHAIVDRVEDEVQPAGRGTHVFPFHRIKVAIVAPSHEIRARLEAVIDGRPPLTDRIMERLRAAGCDPSSVSVKIMYVSQSDSRWTNPAFHVDFTRVLGGLGAETMTGPRSALDFKVVAGTADQTDYSFALERIDLGRCVEVRDNRNRLIRTNHIAFADGSSSINESVSRRHAHITYESSGEYRVYDDGSAHGTCVLRNSTTIAVPSGSRGIRLQSGDEIVLGEARVRVTIEREPWG
jgi:hypothetical protein